MQLLCGVITTEPTFIVAPCTGGKLLLQANFQSEIENIYLFCRYDEDIHHIELDYPRDMSIWQGIGYYINSAFQYTDGKNFVLCT